MTYHTDTETFQAVVSRVLTPQDAFFEQRITITGDLETALKLAVLFDHFLKENLAVKPQQLEVIDTSST